MDGAPEVASTSSDTAGRLVKEPQVTLAGSLLGVVDGIVLELADCKGRAHRVKERLHRHGKGKL